MALGQAQASETSAATSGAVTSSGPTINVAGTGFTTFQVAIALAVVIAVALYMKKGR